MAAAKRIALTRATVAPRRAPLEIRRREFIGPDGSDEIELRFCGGFHGRIGHEAMCDALGTSWTRSWRICSLRRHGDEAVVVLRRV
jgi:hypothetical protein